MPTAMKERTRISPMIGQTFLSFSFSNLVADVLIEPELIPSP